MTHQLEMFWRSIETVPKDGSLFIACYIDATCVRILRWDSQYDEAEDEYGNHVYNLTHWMPVPDPPNPKLGI